MALRRDPSKRLYSLNILRKTSPPVSPNLSQSPSLHRQYFSTPDSCGKGFIRRFLQRRALNQTAGRMPEIVSLPVGEKLRERLWATAGTGSIHLEGLAPPVPASGGLPQKIGLSVADAKKILRLAKMEELKSELRQMPEISIPYREYSKICAQVCGGEDQGIEFAKMLDNCGSVIVLGNVVFLHPEQVAKSMESLIHQLSAPTPDDPRRVELEKLELQKQQLDQKAWAQVWAEIYAGMGFFMAQTLFYMRLTFWELNWDVMEPICFFTGSLYFGLAAAFFLRTSTEPTFEGYSKCRFSTKQKKLIKEYNFDVQRYHDLRQVFYPNAVGFLHKIRF